MNLGNNFFRTLWASFAHELWVICTHASLLLVLAGGIFLYGFLYNYMYEPNAIRESSVAVVDHSATPLSRQYIRLLDAIPQVKVVGESGWPEAVQRLRRQEVVGVLYLPKEFDAKVGRGEQAVHGVYATTTAFLYFAALQEAAAGAMLALNDAVRPEQVVFLPVDAVSSLVSVRPIEVVGIPLYNYTGGYGTYLIPAVLMVIIFQTLLFVIGMLCGREHEMRFADLPIVEPSFPQIVALVWGKALAYGVLYALFAVFMLGFLPYLFQLSHEAGVLNIGRLLVPYLLATSFLGLTFSVCCNDSDAPLLLIAFFSVGLIFVSGVSYPLERMPFYWRWLHVLLPAAPGTLAFVQLSSMGASLSEISTQWYTLWIQCVVYFFTACWAYRYRLRMAGCR